MIEEERGRPTLRFPLFILELADAWHTSFAKLSSVLHTHELTGDEGDQH